MYKLVQYLGVTLPLINQDFQAKETIGICNWWLAEN